MKQRKWTKILFLGIVSASLLAACSESEEGKKEESQAKKETLIVGTSADYEPFEYIKEGEIVGFEVDLTKQMGEELGYKIQFENIPFEDLMGELKEGNIDMVAASMTPTPERMEEADFSDIYYMVNTVVVSKKGNGVQSVDNLTGKKVGAQKGTIQEEKLNELAKEIKGIEVVSYKSVNEIIADVQSGKLKAAIIEDSVVLNYLETEFEAFVIEDENASGSAFAFPKDSELTEEFNGKIKEYKTNEQLEILIKKWLSE